MALEISYFSKDKSLYGFRKLKKTSICLRHQSVSRVVSSPGRSVARGQQKYHNEVNQESVVQEIWELGKMMTWME